MIFPFFIFVLVNAYLVLSGYITPSRGELSIVNTATNANKYANYTFYFILDTTVPPNSTLKITFPQQFSSNLGIDIITADTCSLACTVSSYSALITLPNGLSKAVESSVTINSVKNPDSFGGIGYIGLATYYSNYLFDENKIFGTLGIGAQPGKLTACYLLINNETEAVSGVTTEYRLSFKTIRVIPKNSFMKLTLPLTAKFGFPTNLNCGTFTINGMNLNVSITCTVTDNTIIFTGLTSDIPLNYEVGLKFNLINPPFAGSTDTIIFQIFRMNTHFLYDERTDIPAITIKPNTITSVTLTPTISGIILSFSKIVTFDLKFQSSNPITAGGKILVSFPSTFPLVFNSKIDFVYLVSGINDYNSSLQAAYLYDSTSITINNYQTIAAGTLINIRFSAITPSTAGTSEAIQIFTYAYYQTTSSFRQIDQNINSAVITVQNVPSSSTIFPNGIGISNTNANGGYNTLTFTITPSISIPPGGCITIKIPSDFTVDPPAPAQCLVDVSSTQAQTCTSPSTNTVKVKLPLGTNYYLGVQNTLTLSSLIKNPTLNGTFLFDIETYSSDETTLLESFTDYVVLTGATLTTASGYLIGSTISQPGGTTTDLYSILVIKFTLEKDLPTSSGMIEIRTYPPWSFDLGTGVSDNSIIPCQAISNINNIECRLRIGSLNSPTAITVKGFSTVTSGKAVEIHFPSLLNPISSTTVNFDFYLLNVSNRVYYVLNYKSISISTASTTPTIKSQTYTFSSTPSPPKVSNSFDFEFFPKWTTSSPVTIPSGGYLLVQFPRYDVEFFNSLSSLICKLKTSVTVYVTCTCTWYSSVQWVLIQIASSFIPSSSYPLIRIEGLVWPQIVFTPSVGIITRTLSATNFRDLEYIAENGFITHVAESYTTAEVIVDRNEYNAVGVFYTFNFQANNDIPAGSDIFIAFPSIYNLLSTPQPWLVNINLPSFSSFGIVDLINAKISSVGAIPKTTSFSFQIAGVKNPSFGSASTGWTITSSINGNTTNTYSTFNVKFTLKNLFSAATITVNSLSAFPSNQGLEATYTFDFVTNIPYIVYPTVEIYLIFPSNNYKSLPTIPSCNASLGMNYFSRIALAGCSYLIETAEPLSNLSKRIKFMIKNIRNPSIIGQTEGFSIVFTYDGAIIAQTDTSVTYSISITSSPSPISITSFAVDPLNEAARSVIQLEFSLTNQLSASTLIKLIFPSTYDSKLANDTLSCIGMQSINAELNCWADDAVLTINGITTSSLSANTIIKIQNIINPNYLLNSNTGYLAIATQVTSAQNYLDYLETAGVFTVNSASAYCLISDIQISNLYSRLETDYTFDLTFYTSIPTSLALGKIFIEFPSEYDIPDNSALSCSVEGSDYGTPSCSISGNVASIWGNTKEFSGNLILTLQSLTNPTTVGSIGQFFIYSYDGYDSLILERSFNNFGTFSFSFILKGFPVLVNNDLALTLQVGTQSDLVYIQIDNPSILNLTFKPTVSGLTVIPSSLSLYAGTVSTSFRVSVSESYTVGTYAILWETLNDDDLLFTPLKKTVLYIVDNSKVTINVSPIYDIPLLGLSLPITFSMINPPNYQVEIDISFDNSTLIKASPASLIFSSGVNSLPTLFVPTSVATQSTVTAFFALSGTSSASYVLEKSSFTFQLLTNDLVLPSISSAVITDIARTSVTFNIVTNKPVVCFYMIALAGTNTPTFEEVYESGPPASLSTKSVYGIYVVHQQASFKLGSLLAQTNYSIYVYIQDQLQRTAGPQTLTFQTLDNYRPAEFSIKISKVNTTVNELTWIKQSIAYYLALNLSNIEQRVYDLNLISSEAYDKSQSTILYFYIIAMPFNTILPTPLTLSNSVQGQLQNISTKYAKIDTSYTVKTAEFSAYVPNIVYLSNITTSTDSTFTFNISLDNYGKVFALALPATTTSTQTTTSNSTTNGSNVTSTTSSTTTITIDNSLISPTSFQIYKGLDRYNLNSEAISQSFEISQKNTNFTLTMTGLSQNTSYVLFITMGSVHPYRPDLADYSKIRKLKGKTLLTPVISNVSSHCKRTTPFASFLSLFTVFLLIVLFESP